MRNKMKKGFTLVELMIVVAIMAILAAVSAPKLGDQIKKAKDGKGLAIVGSLRSAALIDYTDNEGTAASSTSALVSEVDSQSQKLITTTASLTFVIVGTNDSSALDAEYTGTDVVIQLDNPDDDAGISIADTENGTDTKGNDWDNY